MQYEKVNPGFRLRNQAVSSEIGGDKSVLCTVMKKIVFTIALKFRHTKIMPTYYDEDKKNVNLTF